MLPGAYHNIKLTNAILRGAKLLEYEQLVLYWAPALPLKSL